MAQHIYTLDHLSINCGARNKKQKIKNKKERKNRGYPLTLESNIVVEG